MKKGKVFLVGAGPGDPELLTIKAWRCLQEADVVLTDRLVSPQILHQYLQPTTKVLYVGKQCRKGASTPQASINELMVIYAREGKQVVRLKGGDVAFFSNVLDELETLAANGIDYEIIPGITAASGASAYAGIPLTARDHATAVRFLTAYKSDVVAESYWKELARTDDTLVFYMSSETLAYVAGKLVLYGIDPDKKAAVIEQATTPFQEVHCMSLYGYAHSQQQYSFMSPTLVIIGKVTALHQQFGWLPKNKERKEYFNSLYETPASGEPLLGLTA